MRSRNFPADRQASITTAMRSALQGVDLTQQQVVLPGPLALAVVSVRETKLAAIAGDRQSRHGLRTPAYSLNPQLSRARRRTFWCSRP